jgi:hypothetical protein
MTFWQFAWKFPTRVGLIVVFIAFLMGMGFDAVGSGNRIINILEPPLLWLMVWNVAIYILIFSNALTKSRYFKSPKPDLTLAMAQMCTKIIAHWAAVAFVLGAITAMYWRGMVFDYQAQWQSTLLTSESVYYLLRKLLMPAVWLGSYFGGSTFPDLASFERLRAPLSLGENAGRWIHWYAITAFIVVLFPRSLLALWSHRQARKLVSQTSMAAKKPSLSPALATEQKTYASIQTIALSLVAHTNVGKTTLARTLLGRDIGEVRDAEHVTHTAEKHVLVESVHQGVLERLELWDTPGFGDSELLAKRMAQAGNPIGWFMSAVWDRFQNRAFWYSQRAVRHILDESDVVLYLINASENPADIAYLDAELKVLDLIGKPVVVILNQVGEPTTPDLASAELQRWKARVAKAKCIKDVLLLDAFTRCWVQEVRLLDVVAHTIPDRQAAFARLNVAWQHRNQLRWQSSMQVLAQRLYRAATDKEVVKETGLLGKITAGNVEKDAALQRLATRLDSDVRSSTDVLIALHQLDGSASKLVLTRLADHVALKAPKSEGKAALLGGVVTGALMGLKADILSGGLTLGGGMLAGGVLGALGGAGLARGYNQVKGIDKATLAWTPDVLDDLTRSALLGYLAIAHFGRGRGAWTHTEPPAFWVERIEAALAPQWGKLHAVWANAGESDPQQSQVELQAVLLQASQAVLQSLYPETGSSA